MCFAYFSQEIRPQAIQTSIFLEEYAPRPSRPAFFWRNTPPGHRDQPSSREIRAPAKAPKLFLQRYASPTQKTLEKQWFFERLPTRPRRRTPRSPYNRQNPFSKAVWGTSRSSPAFKKDSYADAGAACPTNQINRISSQW